MRLPELVTLVAKLAHTPSHASGVVRLHAVDRNAAHVVVS